MNRTSLGIFLGCCFCGLWCSTGVAAEPAAPRAAGPHALASGPAVGEKLPGPFDSTQLTGPDAGSDVCLYCRFGESPMLALFVRSSSPEIVRLLREIDRLNPPQAKEFGRFAVFLSDQTGELRYRRQITKIANQHDFTRIILTTMPAKGPNHYAIAADADLTILLASETTVRAKWVFRREEITPEAISALLADLPKRLPRK
ncbi:hypothetical protein [Tuwongella immobilis]|uniref:Uncharacterized protein n=1 Tax=Tuwongella immobilis TaxID=692036 RepID=A0A6C2YM08_9BACT|nr:hypothetical protein [Tuwongella immobilis]VIP02397.1 Uncharacterized protein OS=Planctomyces brasiliensis (strain ATCC 49424 / DSM 5305 / JCM 21570 / NBRC 103401 / IFAM 1448) GN=Plabr_2110 PE=4 SV=1 [Tuwongella immobilis]VTS01277.1 Uncharacterized protein OS=Planctomyces brasiliensis (strain ATCC 49424 / DSM 5305 / JCM 21570 / NBRC 103401 / IFAM 1448) GN=Plabr_2110 PE=4 SV=1 [Tuwongella immobilis]